MKIVVLFLVLLVFMTGCEREVSYFTWKDEGKSEIREEAKVPRWAKGEIKSPIEEGPFEFRGIDLYPVPEPYSKENLSSLKALLRVEEVNWIQLRFFLYQEDLESSEVSTNPLQDEIIREMIEMIQESGRKVSLKPHLIVGDDTIFWAGQIRPKDTKLWFSSYKKGLLPYANMGADLFAIGNEMVSMWEHHGEWEKLIEEVREIHSGKVTVKLNSFWQKDYFPRLLEMEWLGDLDYIGFSPYFDLVSDIPSGVEEIKEGWYNTRHGLNVVEKMERLSKKFQKEIIFLEIGYRSVSGSPIEPWNYETRVPRVSGKEITPNQTMQKWASQAVFEVFSEKEWFAGTFFFHWPVRIIIDPSDISWSLPGKEVEELIWDKYKGRKE